MESGDIGSRRADCGSAGAVVCDVTALLPLTGTFVSSGSVPFIRDVTVTERVHQSYTMVLVSKPYLTHDTLASPSVDSSPMSSLSNRLCAIETLSILRTKLFMDREFSFPEKRGGLLPNGTRVSDTRDILKGGEYRHCTKRLHLLDQVNQLEQLESSCSQSDLNLNSKSATSTQKDIPLALRTRSKIRHDKSSLGAIRNNESETQFQSSFASETIELLLQLSKQAAERHIEMSSKFQLIYNRQEIISGQLNEFCSELTTLKAQIAIVQLKSQLVKTNAENVDSELTTKPIGQKQQNASNGSDEPDLNSSSASTWEVTKIHDKQASVKPDSSKSRLSSTSETNVRTLQISPSVLSIATNIQLISPDRPKSSSTTNQSRQSIIAAMIESQLMEDDKAKEASKRMIFHHNHNRTMMDQWGHVMPSPPSRFAPPEVTNHKSPEQFAFTATQVQGTPNSAFSQDSPDTSSGKHLSNRPRFRVTSAPEKERKAAQERIKQALDQVPTKQSMGHTGDRTSYDIYVGNLPFHASDDDLFESINPCFKRIQVEKVTVPQRKGGQNRGYGFIRLYWPRGAPIDPADICIQLSGRIKVNSRTIYLCETNNTSSDSSESSDDTSSDPSESATGTDSPATSNRSDLDQSDTAFLGYFSPSGGESEYCPSDGESFQE
jgi:hypothetical protein